MANVHPKIAEQFHKVIAPRYTHDCEGCLYIGHFGRYDCYFCPQGDATIIARYGNEAPEYASGIEFAKRPLAVDFASGEGPIVTEATMAMVCAAYAIGLLKWEERLTEICPLCAVKAVVAGRRYEGEKENILAHYDRVHPDAEEYEREMVNLEAEMTEAQWKMWYRWINGQLTARGQPAMYADPADVRAHKDEEEC